MAPLTTKKATDGVAAFILAGALWFVVVSALDLVCDGYIYGGIGATWGLDTPFVPFSLGLYLFGAAVGAGCYAVSTRPSMRWVARSPAAWIALVFGTTLMLVGSTLVVDVLSREALPLFDVPLFVVALVLGFALFDCAIVSVLASWMLYWLLSGLLPEVAPGRRVIAMAVTFVGSVIAVFLFNDVRVHVDSSVTEPVPTTMAEEFVANPVGTPADTALTFVGGR